MQNSIYQNVPDDVSQTQNIIEVDQKEKVVIQSNLFFHSGDGKSNMGKLAKWCKFLDKNREHMFANSEHVWNVCIKWSYLFRISRFIARKVAWASDDLLILNFFWFLRRHEFRICIFELRFFQKFCSREHSKRLLGRWRKIENSKIHFFGDEYNLIISVELFHTGIGYESYFKTFNLKSIKALSFTAPIELCYSHHWHRNWCIKK